MVVLQSVNVAPKLRDINNTKKTLKKRNNFPVIKSPIKLYFIKRVIIYKLVAKTPANMQKKLIFNSLTQKQPFINLS